MPQTHDLGVQKRARQEKPKKDPLARKQERSDRISLRDARYERRREELERAGRRNRALRAASPLRQFQRQWKEEHRGSTTDAGGAA